DFKIAQTSRSTEFRFVNGVTSYYTNFVYYLTPLRTGAFTLPPVTYEDNGRQHKTRTFTVTVVKGSVAPPTQPRRRRRPSIFDDDDFFSSPFRRRSQPREVDIKVVPVLSKRTVVKGEQIIFKILLYTNTRIQSVNMLSNQSLPGFWQEWFPVSRSIEGENRQIDGNVYQVFEVRKR
ncbi:MAG: protein BatD, partial [bacterium]|nr:protein BatD [bacterium]